MHRGGEAVRELQEDGGRIEAADAEGRCGKERLREAGGGYDIVHESAGLEVGVYVLVAPEPDRQQPHGD